MGEPLLPIVAEAEISAPIDRVWDVLVGEKTLPQWLGAMDYRAEVGTTFFMQQDPEKKAKGDTDGSTWCEIQAMEKSERFQFSWYIPGTQETTVHISLADDGPGKTFVRLIHDGWDDFEREAIEDFYERLAEGWRSAVLPNLKRLAEAS